MVEYSVRRWPLTCQVILYYRNSISQVASTLASVKNNRKCLDVWVQAGSQLASAVCVIFYASTVQCLVTAPKLHQLCYFDLQLFTCRVSHVYVYMLHSVSSPDHYMVSKTLYEVHKSKTRYMVSDNPTYCPKIHTKPYMKSRIQHLLVVTPSSGCNSNNLQATTELHV